MTQLLIVYETSRTVHTNKLHEIARFILIAQVHGCAEARTEREEEESSF